MLGAIPEPAEHALPLVPRRHNVVPCPAPVAPSPSAPDGREVDEVRGGRVVAVAVAAEVAPAVAAAEGGDDGRAGSRDDDGGSGAGVDSGYGGGVGGYDGQLHDGGEEVLQLPRRHTPGSPPDLGILGEPRTRDANPCGNPVVDVWFTPNVFRACVLPRPLCQTGPATPPSSSALSEATTLEYVGTSRSDYTSAQREEEGQSRINCYHLTIALHRTTQPLILGVLPPSLTPVIVGVGRDDEITERDRSTEAE